MQITYHPCIGSIAERISTFQKALKSGTLSPSITAHLGENFSYVYKDGPSPVLGMGHSGSAQPEEAHQFTDKYTIPFIVSVQIEDRDGDVVRSRGVQYKNFSRSPGVFFGHQSWEIPIGQARSSDGKILFWVEDTRVKSACRFDHTDSDAMLVYNKVLNGFLNSTSLAFVPIQAWRRDRHQEKSIYGDEWEKAKPNRDANSPEGWWFEDCDTTEWSVVGVGSNPGALRDIADREKSFMTPKLQKAWRVYAAKSINESGGCFTGPDGITWCPRVEKDLGSNGSAVHKCACQNGKEKQEEEEHKCTCNDKRDESQKSVEQQKSSGDGAYVPNRNWDEEWPDYIPTSDRQWAQQKLSTELHAWRQAAKDHYDLSSLTDRMRHRGKFEATFNALKQAYTRAKRDREQQVQHKSVRKYIKHEGSKWNVYSESGKLLGSHDSKEKAQRQLAAVEVNKSKSASNEQTKNNVDQITRIDSTNGRLPSSSSESGPKVTVIVTTTNWPNLTTSRFTDYMSGLGYKLRAKIGKDGGAEKIEVEGSKSKIAEDILTARRWVDPTGHLSKSNTRKAVGDDSSEQVNRANSANLMKLGSAVQRELGFPLLDYTTDVTANQVRAVFRLGYNTYQDKDRAEKDEKRVKEFLSHLGVPIKVVILRGTELYIELKKVRAKKSLTQADMESARGQAGEIDRTKSTTIGHARQIRLLFSKPQSYYNAYKHTDASAKTLEEISKVLSQIYSREGMSEIDASIIPQTVAGLDREWIISHGVRGSAIEVVKSCKLTVSKALKNTRYVKAGTKLPNGDLVGPDEEGWYVYEGNEIVDGPYDSKTEADREIA